VFKCDEKKSAKPVSSYSKHYNLIYGIWAIYYFTYFGLQYTLFSIGNNSVWINFSLFGFVELIGMYLASSVSRNMQRVTTMRFFLIVASVACLLNIISHRVPFMNLLLFICELTRREVLHQHVLRRADGVHAGGVPDEVQSARYLHLFHVGEVS